MLGFALGQNSGQRLRFDPELGFRGDAPSNGSKIKGEGFLFLPLLLG